MGYFLPEGKADIEPDTYSFDILINDLNYEFQYNINEGETNKDVQNRLARLVNNVNIGLNADVVANDEGATSLRLTSSATGVPSGGGFQFRISDSNTSKRSGSVAYLGIDYTIRPPANAVFTLNGEPRTSASNSFIVGNQFEVTLHNTSNDGNETHIGLKTDVESLTDNISSLIQGYNSFLQAAGEHVASASGSQRLIQEMNSLSSHYGNDLEPAGLHINEDGSIEVNKDQLKARSL